MFIYSMRASTLKFFAVVCVALVTLITLITFVPTYGDASDISVLENKEINYDKIKTAEDRVEFLKQFGWEVAPGEVSSTEVKIPEQFDKIFTAYNEIQRRQGLDLTKYKNKTAVRYTYEITNYEGYDGTVYATLIVYRNKVIGGDICTAELGGKVVGLADAQKICE